MRFPPPWAVEARWIAANMAKLPELLQADSKDGHTVTLDTEG